MSDRVYRHAATPEGWGIGQGVLQHQQNLATILGAVSEMMEYVADRKDQHRAERAEKGLDPEPPYRESVDDTLRSVAVLQNHAQIEATMALVEAVRELTAEIGLNRIAGGPAA